MEERVKNYESLAKGAGLGLIGRFAGRFISVLGSIVAARFLGPTTFGLYAIGLAILRLAEAIVPFGFDFGVVKFGVDTYNQKPREFRGIIIFSLLLTFSFGVGLGTLLFFLAPWLSSSVFMKEELLFVFRFIAFLLPLIGLLTVTTAATRIKSNLRYSVFAQDLGQPVFAFIFLVTFLYFGYRLTGVLLSDFLSYLVSVLVALFFLWRCFPILFNFHLSLGAPSRSYYFFSITSSLTVILSTMMFWVDRIIIGYFLPAQEIGFYQAASQISVVFAVILSGLNRILVPIYANLHNLSNLSEIEEIYRIGTKWAIYIGAPILIILFISPASVLGILYGGEYAVSANILIILLIGQVINLVTGSVAPMLLIGGFQRYVVFLSSISLLLNVFLSVFLTPRMGAFGTALSVSISTSLLYLGALFVARNKMKVWPYDKRYLKGLSATIVSVISGILIIHFWERLDLVGLLVLCTGVLIVFAIVLYLLRLDYEDQIFISMIRNQLNSYRRK